MNVTPCPTADEMRAFSERFKPAEWEILCRHQEFLDTVSTDTKKCRLLAEKLLHEAAKIGGA